MIRTYVNQVSSEWGFRYGGQFFTHGPHQEVLAVGHEEPVGWHCMSAFMMQNKPTV